MADVTPILINQLTSQTTLQDTDYFIVGGDDAKKITVAQMKEALGINSLNTNMITTEDFTVSTVSGSIKYTNGSGSTNFDVTKEGYKAIGIVGFSVSSTFIVPSAVMFDLSNQKASMTARHVNETTTSGNVNAYISVLYIKNT